MKSVKPGENILRLMSCNVAGHHHSAFDFYSQSLRFIKQRILPYPSACFSAILNSLNA
jgi:hypothetical protein